MLPFRHTTVVLVLSLMIIGAAPVLAQGPDRATIEGVVVSRPATAVAGARLTLTDSRTGFQRTAVADASGYFRFALLPPASYTMFVEQIGYRPRVVKEVIASPGAIVSVPVELREVELPVNRADTVVWEAGVRLNGDHYIRQLSRYEIEDLAYSSRGAAELQQLPAEPPSRGKRRSVSVNGLPVAIVRHPVLGPLSPTVALPLTSVGHGEIVSGPLDPEWSWGTGEWLNLDPVMGTRRTTVETSASWGDDAGTTGVLFGEEEATRDEIRLASIARGPIIADSAVYAVGVEGWSSETSYAPVLDPLTQDSLSLAGTPGLEALEHGAKARNEFATAFGRLDWMLAGGREISLRGSVGYAGGPSHNHNPATVPAATLFEGTDIRIGGQFVTARRWGGYSVSMGFDRVARSDVVGPEPTDLINTRFARPIVQFGAAGAFPASFQRTELQGRYTLHFFLGSHRAKIGADFVAPSYVQDFTYQAGGEFTFGDADHFLRGEGAFVQTVAAPGKARFSTFKYGLFAQDRWVLGDGLEITAGLRLDTEDLPEQRVGPNSEWESLSGLARAVLPDKHTTVSPRIGLRWDVQNRHEWLFEAGVAVFNDAMSPDLLAELIRDDGRYDVRRGLGLLGNTWPDLPALADAPVVGPSLSLPGESLRAPRVTRAMVGVSAIVGRSGVLRVSGRHIHYAYLPLLRDLNLPAAAVARDPDGRPLFGDRVRYGGAVTAEPESNRRFAGFDRVTAYESRGSADRWGINLFFEQHFGDLFSAAASYTYSRTTDDTPGGGSGDPRLSYSAFATDPRYADWTEGTSDFDIPHAAAISFTASLPAVLRPSITGLFRYESGRPFTPGYGPGIDMDGDGISGNDPAFIDGDVQGVDLLFADWPCLTDQLNQFAGRNSCRGKGRYSLDLRLSLLVLPTRIRGTLFMDAQNIIGEAGSLPDPGLYLLGTGPSGRLDSDTEVPLVANPDFGKTDPRSKLPLVVRIGLRINY